MNVLCFGSLNIDYVYSVEHIVMPGETLSSSSFFRNPGGKGANQSAALAKAGLNVFHAGIIGEDGRFLAEKLASYNVNIDNISIESGATGHAIIQLDRSKQNSIILFSGKNRCISDEMIDRVLSNFSKGDYLVLQNEINNLPTIINKAYEKGMVICLNPAPFDESIFSLPLEKVSTIVINEVEGAGMAGMPNSSDYDTILEKICESYPKAEILMTLGKHGSIYQYNGVRYSQNIIDLPVKDTTAAGDTMIGYFIASKIYGYDIKKVLLIATAASALTVSKEGAMDSIPYWNEVDVFLDSINK